MSTLTSRASPQVSFVLRVPKTPLRSRLKTLADCTILPQFVKGTQQQLGFFKKARNEQSHR